MTEQKQEPTKKSEDKKQKIIVNAFGEKIVVNEIGWSWGKTSFYLSLVAALLILLYWLFAFTKAIDLAWTIYILIILINLTVPLGVSLGTGVIILLDRFSCLKDKCYALAGFVISVITFTYTIYYFFLF